MYLKMLLVSLASFAVVLQQNHTAAAGLKRIRKNLTIAWIEKPPYTMKANMSLAGLKPIGLIRITMWRFMELGCDPYSVKINTVQVENINALQRLLQEGKANVGLPVFMSNLGEYKGMLGIKVLDHPGLDFITTGKQRHVTQVIIRAVFDAWPLLLFTMLLTAIAGVMVWALDSRWNREEFPRSFLKGSWEGFWWSFVSMTTVGYGDRTPKSSIARVLSMVWILTGIICMAIFVAHITSVLTSISLDHGQQHIVGEKVAVLKNETEYGWAKEMGSKPIAYETIDDMVKAVKKQEVKGMLIDRLMAGYYERKDKLGSLLTAREFSVQTKVGVIFTNELKGFVDCLALLRPAIDTTVEDITSTYKRKPQKVPQNDFLLANDSPWMINTLYILSGVLALLVISGLLWDFIDKKRVRKTEQDLEAVGTCEIEMDVNALTRDIDEGQQLLTQLKDYITRLQGKTQDKHKRDLKTSE